MNKDVKGLLKYLLIMLIIWLMLPSSIYCGFGALYYDGRTLSLIYFAHAVVLFILYFILPIIFTYKAMKYHWSKYLDKFFYHKWLSTIIFGLFIILNIYSFLYDGSIYNHNIFQNIITIICLFIAPTYYLTYILMLIMRGLELL